MKVLKEGFDGNHFDKYSSKKRFIAIQKFLKKLNIKKY